jgi:DNA-binding GntR family transcriptional regulator
MHEKAVARANIAVFGSKMSKLGCTPIDSTPMSTVSTKADDIAGILEDEIVGGAIPPGTVLRQETLSERFDVSRTPVREALRRLAALGLVSFEPNRGVRVRSISADELHEAFLVRAELEALATEVATPKMTPDDLAEMDRIERRFGELTLELRDQARSGAPRDAALFVEWMQANYAFHDVIYRVAELPLVERIAKGARRTFIGDRAWRARAELDELYAKNDLQHRAIREAISAGSARAARTLAREHVLSSNRLVDVVLETLGAAGREPGWGK